MSTLYESAIGGNPAVEPIDLARAYVSAITGSADTPMQWRACHDTDKGAPAKSFFGTVDHLWRELFDLNMQGWGIFAVVSSLDGNGRKLENVTSIRAHFIDLDKGSVAANAARAAASHPAPCFKVHSSPGKVHIYWCVEAYSGNDRFQTLQRKLVQTYDSDPQVIDATRLMRVPGSWHMKGDVPHLVTCELLPGYTNPRTTIEAMEAAYAHVQVIHGGAGERHELGEPELAAPSLEWLQHALALVDPNDLDRLEWISLTAAVKQSGWTLTDPDSLYAIWAGWCERYAANDPGENLKQWSSIRNTELGWHSILRRVPSLKASMAFGVNGEGVPTAPPMPGQSLSAEPMASTAIREVDFWATFNADDAAKASAIVCTKVLAESGIPIAHDEFADRLMITARVPWDDNYTNYPREWTDNDTHGCKALLEMSFIKPSKETVADSVRFVALRRKYHPVRDYLTRLQWDGTPRLESLAFRYFGASDTPYGRAVGTRYLISAVARIMRPGCKVDTMLILEGEQGKRKSTALRTLVGDEWFTDQLPDLTSKDASIQLRGKWLIEIAELDRMNRAEVTAVKSYASRQVDTYRPPYGRVAIDVPRQCVFAGSTNEHEYLRDQTGNRRYWPIECGDIDVAAITQDRDQLWAEAVHLHRAGEQHWLTDAEEQLAREAQDDRRERHPWEARLSQHITRLRGMPVTMEQACHLLEIPFERQNSATNKIVAGCLRATGFKRTQMRTAEGRSWVYVLSD